MSRKRVYLAHGAFLTAPPSEEELLLGGEESECPAGMHEREVSYDSDAQGGARRVTYCLNDEELRLFKHFNRSRKRVKVPEGAEVIELDQDEEEDGGAEKEPRAKSRKKARVPAAAAESGPRAKSRAKCRKKARVPVAVAVAAPAPAPAPAPAALAAPAVSEVIEVYRSEPGDGGGDYTPSHPLGEASAGLRDGGAGFMTVSNVFSSHILAMLTWGKLESSSGRGRVTHRWNGVLSEFHKHMTFDRRDRVVTTSTEVVHREGRYDMKLPGWVVEELHLGDILEAVLKVLREVMAPGAQLRTHNVVYVPRDSPVNQPWHMDDKPTGDPRVHKYFTILVHLNPTDARCGGTEVRDGDGNTFIVRAKPGDAFVFHGALNHRGLANCGQIDRLFYYASFSCHKDRNDHDL